MKIIIESSLILLPTAKENSAMLAEFNTMLMVLESGFKDLISTRHFFVYKGGNHIAIHQIIKGEPREKRFVIVEFN